MSAPPHTCCHPGDRNLRVGKTEKKQAHVILPVRAPLANVPQVAQAGERGLGRQSFLRGSHTPSISASMSRPALTATTSGANGDNPAAIRFAH